MFIPTMDVTPVKAYIPETLTEERLDYEEARDLKLGMEDSTLERYYTQDIVEVLEVGEANDYTNVRIPDRVIEKIPQQGKEVNELSYGILADELGTGVDILYIREEDGEVRYGMPYLADAGQFKDIEFNGFLDFLEYTEAVGRAYGPLYWSDIMHEDLIGMRCEGRLRHTPYLRNMMVSGFEDLAHTIDYEDAHLADMVSPKTTETKHIKEMQPENRDDEYDAIFAALLSEALNSIDFMYDRVAERPIQKPDLISVDSETGLDYVDIHKLVKSDASNEDLQSMIHEIEERFEDGWRQGSITVQDFYRNQHQSEVPRRHERKDRLQDAARARLEEDIEPAVERWFDELGV